LDFLKKENKNKRENKINFGLGTENTNPIRIATLIRFISSLLIRFLQINRRPREAAFELRTLGKRLHHYWHLLDKPLLFFAF